MDKQGTDLNEWNYLFYVKKKYLQGITRVSDSLDVALGFS